MMKMTMPLAHRLPIALLMGSLVLDANVGASRPQSTAVTMAGYPAPGAPPIVTLLSAGAEPRTRLRYAIARTYKEHMATRTQLSLSVDMAGTPMPPMQMPMMTQGADLTVTDVAASGDISYAVTFTGFGVETPAPGDPAMDAAFQSLGPMMQSLDEVVKSITGGGTISDRGLGRSVHFDLSKVTNPLQRQMMEPVSNAVQNLSTPLPEEAVGVAARWEVRQQLTAGGIQVFQKTIYELVSLEGKTARLKAAMEQTAPPQALDTAALPPGADMRVQKYSGAGSSTIAVRLDALVPTSDASMQTNLVADVTMGGSVATVTTATTVKISVAAAK
jgi:hypothetical protein